MLSLMILLGCLASAHGYWCGLCNMSDKTYCCYDERDSHFCCSWDEYARGGFMDMRTMTIVVSAAAVIAVLVVITVCCFCCPCCLCYKRRRQGTVYNSVPYASSRGARPPIFQAASPGMDPRLSSVQYPVQHPSNPYIDPNASAPPYYPTATK